MICRERVFEAFRRFADLARKSESLAIRLSPTRYRGRSWGFTTDCKGKNSLPKLFRNWFYDLAEICLRINYSFALLSSSCCHATHNPECCPALCKWSLTFVAQALAALTKICVSATDQSLTRTFSILLLLVIYTAAVGQINYLQARSADLKGLDYSRWQHPT